MDLVIGGNSYQVGKLDAFKQFHVARRLAPALWALGSAALTILKQPDAQDDGDVLAALTGAAGPLVDVIASMSDKDSQYVLDSCLSVCSRLSGNGYQKIFIENGGMLFADIDLKVMMQLVIAVIQANLGNFLDALPATP